MPSEKLYIVTDDYQTTNCVKELKKLMLGDENLKNLQSDDEYLVRFLECKDFSVKEAYQKMKTFYDLLEEYPEWFTIKSPSEKKSIIDKDVRVTLGEHDKEGRPLYLVKLANMDPSTMKLIEDIAAVDDICIETLLAQTPSACARNGLCVVIDISHFPVKLMKWLTPNNIRTIVKRIQAMPIKEYRYHVVNNSLMVQAAIKVVWPFLPESFRKSIKFHFDDRSSLYEYIDEDVLPIDLGGKRETDYRKCHVEVYNKNESIVQSFKIHRESYLRNLKNDK